MSIPKIADIQPQPGVILGRALNQSKRTDILVPDGSQVAPGEFPRLLVLAAGGKAREAGILPGCIAHFMPGSEGTMRAMHQDQPIDVGILDAGYVIATSPGLGVTADEFADFRAPARRGPGGN